MSNATSPAPEYFNGCTRVRFQGSHLLPIHHCPIAFNVSNLYPSQPTKLTSSYHQTWIVLCNLQSSFNFLPQAQFNIPIETPRTHLISLEVSTLSPSAYLPFKTLTMSLSNSTPYSLASPSPVIGALIQRLPTLPISSVSTIPLQSQQCILIS